MKGSIVRPDFRDGRPHNVRVRVHPSGEVTVHFDQRRVLSQHVEWDKFASRSPLMWMGFTASTGGAYEAAIVHNWTVRRPQRGCVAGVTGSSCQPGKCDFCEAIVTCVITTESLIACMCMSGSSIPTLERQCSSFNDCTSCNSAHYCCTWCAHESSCTPSPVVAEQCHDGQRMLKGICGTPWVPPLVLIPILLSVTVVLGVLIALVRLRTTVRGRRGGGRGRAQDQQEIASLLGSRGR